MEPGDIYGDLDDFNLGDTIAEFDEKNKVLTKTVEESEKRISVLADEVSTLKKVNADLKVNISELYKTAKAEIERKTRQIADLRREIDDTVSRRNPGSNSATAEKYSQEKCELMKEVAQFKHVLSQKDRIINSLNKELEGVKTPKSDLKRNSSHIVNETDDTVYKRQKNSNFERDSEHFGDSKPYWMLNYRPKEFDERRNRSGSRSPDRRIGYRRNSDFRPINDRRLNQFKGRYDSRGHCNNRQFNNRFKYNKNDHDIRKHANFHSRSPEFQNRQADNNKFTYNNYTSSENCNRPGTSYNLRTSVGDRREDTAKWCEKTSEPMQDTHPVNCPPLISQKPQKNGNYRREDMEEGELNSTYTDNNEDSKSVNNMTILKEDIRTIVRVEDILNEGKSKDKIMESSKIDSDKKVKDANTTSTRSGRATNANVKLLHKSCTKAKDKLMDTCQIKCVNSDKKFEDLSSIPGSKFKNTRTENSSASASNCHETNMNVRLVHKYSTNALNNQKITQPCFDPSTSRQVTHPGTNVSLSEPPLQNHTVISISNRLAQSCIDASRCEPPKQNHTSPSNGEQAALHCIDTSLSEPPMQSHTGFSITNETVHPCIDTSRSEPPTQNHTSVTPAEEAADLCTDASLSEPPTKNHTGTPTSGQSIQPFTDSSLSESSMFNCTNSSVSEQSSQNAMQLIPKKKITGKRRRCIISIT